MCADNARCLCVQPLDEFWIDRFVQSKEPVRRNENFLEAQNRLFQIIGMDFNAKR